MEIARRINMSIRANDNRTFEYRIKLDTFNKIHVK